MSTTAAILRAAKLPHELREALVAANASTLTTTNSHATLASLEQKRGLDLLVAGGATRAQINALNLTMEEKKAMLDIANV